MKAHFNSWPSHIQCTSCELDWHIDFAPPASKVRLVPHSCRGTAVRQTKTVWAESVYYTFSWWWFWFENKEVMWWVLQRSIWEIASRDKMRCAPTNFTVAERVVEFHLSHLTDGKKYWVTHLLTLYSVREWVSKLIHYKWFNSHLNFILCRVFQSRNRDESLSDSCNLFKSLLNWIFNQSVTWLAVYFIIYFIFYLFENLMQFHSLTVLCDAVKRNLPTLWFHLKTQKGVNAIFYKSSW